jgi:hypothetical protein
MLEHAARRAVELRYGFLVRGDDVHDILAAPIDDAGVALAHGHAHVHGGTFDESAHAARFFARSFAFTAQLLALEIQFISVAPAGGLLAIKKLYELFLANIGGGSTITLGAVHANLDEIIQGFKFCHRAILQICGGIISILSLRLNFFGIETAEFVMIGTNPTYFGAESARNNRKSRARIEGRSIQGMATNLQLNVTRPGL